MDTRQSGELGQPPTKKQKRPRAIQACESCRHKKNKCDEAYPCAYCVRHRVECIYRNPDVLRKLPPSNQQSIESPPRQASELRTSYQMTCSATEDPAIRFDNSHNALCATQPLESPGVTVFPQQRLSMTGSGTAALREPHGGTKTERDSITGTSEDVTDVNMHTKSIEFHGSSSSVAFLKQVQSSYEGGSLSGAGIQDPSLVSMLHNSAFDPTSTLPMSPQAGDLRANQERFYFRVSGKFLEGYFESIQYVQPFLDREEFMTRCEDMWFGKSTAQANSFHALYYSILSLGALVRTWDEETLHGLNRFQWSRKLFDEARTVLSRLGTTTNLEMVQCLLIMGKICQHELNPHVAYMYIGLSTRTALAIGLNREPSSKYVHEDESYSRAAWKTWWVLYSLEWPDTLGDDRYHNRCYPSSSPAVGGTPATGPGETSAPDLAIIPAMVEFSRIIKKLCLDIYMATVPSGEKLRLAQCIEVELDNWMNKRSVDVRPSGGLMPLKSIKGWKYVMKQQLVLKIRYHNARILLYGSFLTAYGSDQSDRSPLYMEGIEKCVDSAIQTVQVIHETYSTNHFFQTWWYNTTYILFAVTILLIHIFQSNAQLPTKTPLPILFQSVEKAVEILEVMDECLVAKNACTIIKRTLARARELSAARSTPPDDSAGGLQPNVGEQKLHSGCSMNSETNGSSMLGIDSGRLFNPFIDAIDGQDGTGEGSFRWDLGTLMDDEGQTSVWTDWENSLSLLGSY